MATLSSRITDLAAAVRAKFNLVTPRLLPAGGSTNQTLRKSSGTDYAVAWTSDWTYVKLAADFTTTGVTAADSGLSFTPAANKTYVVEGLLLLRSNFATAGAQPGIVFPTGMTDQVAEIITASTTATTEVVALNTGSTTFKTAGANFVNTTTSWFGRVTSLLVTGASPSGDFKVQLASSASGKIATLKAGSYIRYRDI